MASADALVGTHDPKTGKPKKNVLVYGESGSGKTRFASTWPDPIVVDIEGGMDSIVHEVARFPKDPEKTVTTLAELDQILAWLSANAGRKGFPYQTVVIDSLNELQEVILQQTVDNHNIKRFYGDLPSQSDYGKMLRDFYKYIREFMSLPINVVFTAVQTNRQFADEKVEPAFIGKKTSKEVCRLMDMVGHTDVVNQGGDLKYLISFVEGPQHIAKDRSPKTATKAVPNDYKYLEKRF